MDAVRPLHSVDMGKGRWNLEVQVRRAWDVVTKVVTHQLYFVSWCSQNVPCTLLPFRVVIGVVGTGDFSMAGTYVVTASRWGTII